MESSVSLPFLVSAGCSQTLASGAFLHFQSVLLQIQLPLLNLISMILSLMLPSFKDPHYYIGSTWLIEDNLPFKILPE